MTFAAFASIYLFLSLKLLQLLLLAMDLTIAIPFHNIEIMKLQPVQQILARIVTCSPRFSRITNGVLSFNKPAYLHSLVSPARPHL